MKSLNREEYAAALEEVRRLHNTGHMSVGQARFNVARRLGYSTWNKLYRNSDHPARPAKQIVLRAPVPHDPDPRFVMVSIQHSMIRVPIAVSAWYSARTTQPSHIGVYMARTIGSSALVGALYWDGRDWRAKTQHGDKLTKAELKYLMYCGMVRRYHVGM